jgi:hypothetical protein
MTRAHHVTHSYTAARAENIRKLIAALMVGQLARDEIGALLKVGPSGVRKYLADLKGKVDKLNIEGEQVCRLAISAKEAEVYLNSLDVQVPARPVNVASSEISMPSPGRRFHILADDTHYAIRVSRVPVARDWSVTALFGAGPARAEVRA